MAFPPARSPTTPTFTTFVPWARRFAPLAGVGYVAALSIAADRGHEPFAWVAAAIGLSVAAAASRQTQAVLRVAGWGAAVVVASLGADHGFGPDACGVVGLFATVAAASVAIARIPGEGGVVKPLRGLALPLAGIVATAVASCAAVAAFASPTFLPMGSMGSMGILRDHPRAWGWAAAFAGAAVLAGTTERMARLGALELGVSARTHAMRSLFVALVVAAFVVAVCGPVRGDHIGRLALAFGATAATLAATYPDAVRVVQVVRRSVALATTGGVVALVGAMAVEGRADPWVVTLVTAAVALAVGSVAEVLEAPFRPTGGAWLEAFSRAADEALRADPDDAIREALVALRAPVGLGSPGPQLWVFGPTRVITVDTAGYLHENEAELPDTLALVVAAEPYASLRADALYALAVRRPDLRPLGTWLSARSGLVVTLIACDGEAEGLLVVPRGQRADPITLEEVVAVKRAADNLSRVCRARATNTRMLARAEESKARAEAAEAEAQMLRAERARGSNRHALVTARAARSATVGIYSAAARMAVDALAQCAATGGPILVVAPSGVDPIPFLARAHLSGPRAHGPFVVVDATCLEEHDEARWTDPGLSPLALAAGGMLVVLDAAALPHGVQRVIADALGGRPPGRDGARPLELQIALTSVSAQHEVSLAPALAVGLSGAPVVLPRLQDRPEDFRALLTDRLAREGLRVLGRPVGIQAAAYARLAEHEFPGDEVELTAMVQRLVAACAAVPPDLGLGRDTVCLADVEPPKPRAIAVER